MTNVTLIGATGLVGRAALAELGARPQVERVTVYARGSAPAESPAKVDWHAFPWLDHFYDAWEGPGGLDAMAAAIGGTLAPGQVLLSCLGTTRRRAGSAARFRFVDYAVNAAFALAARRAGYARYGLVSAYGADAGSRLLYPRTKGELDDYVRGLGFGRVVLCRPGLLSGERDEGRFGESLMKNLYSKVGSVWPGFENKAYGPIGGPAVARALVRESLDAPNGVQILYNVDMKNVIANG